jgi:hypothetical protein
MNLVWDGFARTSLLSRRAASAREPEEETMVFTALLIETGVAVVVAATLTAWARRRFTPRQESGEATA